MAKSKNHRCASALDLAARQLLASPAARAATSPAPFRSPPSLARSAHNATRKAHRNGIKRPKSERYMNQRGVDPKMLRNKRFALKVRLRAACRRRSALALTGGAAPAPCAARSARSLARSPARSTARALPSSLSLNFRSFPQGTRKAGQRAKANAENAAKKSSGAKKVQA